MFLFRLPAHRPQPATRRPIGCRLNRVHPLAKKPNYGFQKHMKELARKKKKDEKREQRRDAAAAKRENPDDVTVEGDTEDDSAAEEE